MVEGAIERMRAWWLQQRGLTVSIQRCKLSLTISSNSQEMPSRASLGAVVLLSRSIISCEAILALVCLSGVLMRSGKAKLQGSRLSGCCHS